MCDCNYSDVIAIYKEISRERISTYRPVSLTSVLCGFLERLVRAHLGKYFMMYSPSVERNMHSPKRDRVSQTFLGYEMRLRPDSMKISSQKHAN